MKLTLFILSFLLLLIIPPSLHAEETGMVIGEGARSCKDFSKGNRNQQGAFLFWAQGYFSAYNGIAPDIKNVLEGHDFRWVTEKLKRYCKANPDHYFNDAVVSLLKELHPKGIRVYDPLKIRISAD